MSSVNFAVPDFCLGKRQLLAINALDADRLAARGPVFPNSPDVTTEIASHLTVPFEGTPFVASPVIREHETLELNPSKSSK